jgi:hypothetical protein
MNLRQAADVQLQGSLSNALRARRFTKFAALVDGIDAGGRTIRILDIGGTEGFWISRGWSERADLEITLANIAEPKSDLPGNLRAIRGDATNLAELPDQSFDVVFSNSTIEHLGYWGAQRAMAAEVLRLAPRYWVQTPNFWFPIEPHFLTIGWHYLPPRVRGRLLQRRSYGHRPRVTRPARALELVEEIRLVTAREMRLLFPDAELLRERVGPFTKSLVAHRF